MNTASTIAMALALVTQLLAACDERSAESPTNPEATEAAGKHRASATNRVHPTPDEDGVGDNKEDVPRMTLARPNAVEPSLDPAVLRRHTSAANELGFQMFREIAERDNLIVSPASLHLGLALAWLGAEGATRGELQKALGIEDEAAAEKSVATLLREWNDPALAKTELRVVNRFFGDQRLEIEGPYQAAAQRFFAAPLERVDFKGKPEPSRVHINDWVSRATMSRIENLLPPGSIDDESRAVLVNAIYFLAKWQEPFAHDATRDAPFHTRAGEAKRVPTMHAEGHFRYAEDGGVKILEMPYQNSRFAMLFVLPPDTSALPSLEAKLSSAIIDRWAGKLSGTSVEVALPKFEVRGESLELSEPLRKIGIRLPFQPVAADFTRITNPADPRERLVINKVFHKGSIRVDEDGTEAAAATATVMMEGGAAPSSEPKRFIADRPFLFVLRDESSGAILFSGRITDPSA